MASKFQQESLKIVIGQICQTIGFQGINSIPLDVMIDLLHRYIRELAISTVRYTEHAGRTAPNLDDLSLAFKEMGISLSELEDYVTNVEPTPFPHEVPKIPVARQSNLNFLKPGAREIVSRPLHIHEHLPPMYPEKEEQDVGLNAPPDNLENEVENSSEIKTPISPSRIKRSFSEGEMSPNKKYKTFEEEGEPVREIDSVMMTTSGFISSAREGKFPEAKRPNIPMTLPRSNSPTSHKVPSIVKKKATMEKIIRNKNHHVGIIPGSLSNSKSKEFKFKPKIPSAPPGTGSLKYSRPGGIPPKLKIPVPNLPPTNVVDSGIVIGDTDAAFPKDTPEKKKRRERDRERRRERKREREEKKDKKDDKPKKERSKDDRRRRDKAHHAKLKNERTRIRMKGLTKEEELRRYKERENELIAALAASSAVTVTSIPPPSLRVREKSPEKISEKTVTSPQESKSKLSIFKKVSKSTEGDKYHSRENSPKLMIDDIVKEEPKSPPPSPTIDYAYHEESAVNSSLETPSTPKTPDILPAAKNKRGRPHKIKLEDGTYLSPSKKSPKVKKTSSPRGRKRGSGIFSPSWRHPMGEITPDRPNLPQSISDRPKTPEGVISQDDGPCLSSFSIPSFPNAPGFIPPFSRFTFGPFGTPSLVPPVLAPSISDSPINALSRVFINSFNDKVDEMEENRPPTPSHEGIQSGPMNTEKDNLLHTNLSPLPETPKLLSVEASPHSTNKPEKLSKQEKEKKKEHKKEKKEKEKLRKKKEKKDKEKAKEEKKREKERLKHEKKEKRKRGRKRSDTGSKDSGVPKITFKLPADGSGASSSSALPLSTTEHKPTPKLVIKPVVKHPNEESKMLLSLESKKRPPIVASSPRLPSIKLPPQDEPGSPPEIAKFSPLITRPPKLKLSSKKNSLEILTVPPLKIKDPSSLKISKNEVYKESHKDYKDSHREHKEYKDQHREYKEHHKEGKEHKEFNKEHKESSREYKEPKEFKDFHKAYVKEYKEPHKEYKDIYKEFHKESRDSHKEFPKDLIISHIPATVPPLKIRNAPPSKGFENKKFSSIKKSEKKAKNKKDPSQSTSPSVDNTTIKITGIPPTQPSSCSVVPEHIKPRLSTPTPKGSRNSSGSVSFGGLASAIPQTSADNPNAKISATGLVTETVGPIGHFVDDQGNEVWICPTCGKQDDGSPMIGCDTCDDWYHWLCVGIHVPPRERENWYCPRCLSQHKQKGLGLIEKKKRGRKRKFPTPL